ncbi:MAG: type I-U CRISPR-associated helicase/endonuclease Cas3 [Chromatiales bacterium]|nr:type I-U CRISPR-associated helicase/endonuclease Cas3 [Chromatiales bacterium]
MTTQAFEDEFRALTGFPPQPWQQRLFREHFANGALPSGIDIPTGLGKTAVIALWLIAIRQGIRLPRRLVYVVDRRAVVDQATDFVNKLRQRLPAGESLPVSTLRGQHADNREWLDDPATPAIVVGTVDMIGSRLLFEGYGVSRRMRPYHAGLLGADTLVVLDEAHLVPPFEHLLAHIAGDAGDFSAVDPMDAQLVPKLHLLSLSATGRRQTDRLFRLMDEQDLGEAGSLTHKRLTASKRLQIMDADPKTLADNLARTTWELAEELASQGHPGGRFLVYCNARDNAEKAEKALREFAKQRAKVDPDFPEPAFELFIGARRGHERELAAQWLNALGFLGDTPPQDDRLRFLIATSAGEVGVDLDADHMVCDLVAWDRMIQRLGRVNRRGQGDARIVVLDAGPDVSRLDDRHPRLRELLAALPAADGWHDASPDALRRQKLNANADLQAALSDAVTPEPLRPALTRPLLDAWSMTTLKEHTGRPEVAPWLRGWIDEEPQTTVVWRHHLPVPVPADGEPERVRPRDVEAYFEATPPHLSEQLDTETYRVVDWAIARAKDHIAALKKLAEKHPEQAQTRLQVRQIAAIALTAAGDFERAFTIEELAEANKDRLTRELAGRLLIVHHQFGGCGERGTLDPKHEAPPTWLGDNDGADLDAAGGTPEHPLRWCVVDRDGNEQTPNQSGWYKRFELPLSRHDDGEVKRRLLVYKWRQDAANENDRAIGHDQSLVEHQNWAAERAADIANRLGLPESWCHLLKVAARLHDEGKRAERWQRAFNAPRTTDGTAPYAKTRGPLNLALLDGYRHEFGSLFHAEADAEFQALSRADQDLVLHLIAAHHGNARPTISTRGCDQAPPSQLAAHARAVALRFAHLQRRWGPWGLAWWEALLRAADQQASKANESRADTMQGGQN